MPKLTGTGNFTITLEKHTLGEVRRELDKLSVLEQNAVIQRALVDAAKPIEAAGRSNYTVAQSLRTAPKRPTVGKPLVDTIGHKIIRGVNASIKLHVGSKRPKGSLAHLLDRGTAKRWYVNKNGKKHYTGYVYKSLGPHKGSKYFTDAFNSNERKSKDIIIKGIEQGITQITHS